jgi:phytoene dehydrogenase-like protein
MPEKSIIIIGAGMAGLSAGCYGQMNGYRTQIFEKHTKPGGLCTAWTRKGYTIDTPGYLMGSGPGQKDYYQMWQELGALQGRTVLDYEEYARIEGTDGQVLTVYTDIDRLDQHMRELAPEDKEVTAEFADVLRAFTGQQVPVDMGKWMGMSLRGFADQYKNTFVRQVLSEGLPFMFFFEPEASVMAILSALSLMHLKSAGYPVGGFLELAKAIEQRYLDLGGEIHYRSAVDTILVDKDKAVGVRLADGTEHRGDIVISAADGRTTIFDMLEGKHANDEIRGYYDTLPRYSPILFISLGVDRSFEGLPISVAGDIFPLEEEITIAGGERKRLGVLIYGFDRTLAPPGKTLLRVLLPSDYEYWRALREQDRARYRAEKEQVADQVIAMLDRRYPGLAAQVEMRDVATPVTFERYTGNWEGTWLGWLTTPQTMNVRMSNTLPGLDDFYMAGTWVMAGSLPGAAASGRGVAEMICKEEKKPFVTAVP